MEAVDGEYQTFKCRDGAYVREHFFGKYPELREMVADDVRRGHLAPEPRRPRSAQGLRGVLGGDEARGPADGDPREDGQGLRHGRGGRGQEHRPPAEEDAARGAARSSATASRSRSPTTSWTKMPYYRPAPDSPEAKYMRERAREAGRAAAAAPAQEQRKLEAPQARRLQAAARGDGRRPRDLHDDGVRAHPDQAR